MKNKNILIVAPYFYPEGGGLELYASKISNYLYKKNNVTVVCATKTASRIKKIKKLEIIRSHPSFFISNTPIDFKLKKRIKEIIELKKINLIIAHSPVPFYADMAEKIAKEKNIPFVLHYHVSSLYRKKGFMNLIVFVYEKFFEKKLFKTAKKIICNSTYAASRKLSAYKDKTTIVPPFIDLNKFKPTKLNRKSVLFVAQLGKSSEQKGLNHLITAFSGFLKKNPEYDLVIVGDGTKKKYYEKGASILNLKNKIRFLGNINQKKIPEIYASCSFVVIPSLSNMEGTTTVLFEAMASGKPVIAGNVGGITHILKKEKTGILVNANNIDQLAKKMDELANNKALYNKFVRNCAEGSKKYALKTRLKEIEKIYESAIEEKYAIFHPYLNNIGGSEIVALSLAKKLKADVYTTNIDLKKIKEMGFSKLNIFSIGKVPNSPGLKRQIAFLRFRMLNLKNKYNFYIISGDWAMSGAVKNKPNLWYALSPLNEIWQFKSYVKNLLPFWQKPFFEIWVLINRFISKIYINEINVLACDSNIVKDRIKKFFGKDATTIYPGIKTSQYKHSTSKNYWLSVNRLIETKRIDLQLSTFAEIPKENLIIVGSYEKTNHFFRYIKYLKKIQPKNVKIESWVTQKKLIQLYSECKGVIATSKDEDFGMNAVEAMASGKPVIAPNEGGYKETIVNKKTGILINNLNKNSLISAVTKMSRAIEKNPLSFKNNCQKRAAKFDEHLFIKKLINSIYIYTNQS